MRGPQRVLVVFGSVGVLEAAHADGRSPTAEAAVVEAADAAPHLAGRALQPALVLVLMLLIFSAAGAADDAGRASGVGGEGTLRASKKGRRNRRYDLS